MSASPTSEEPTLEGGNYEVIRDRLRTQAAELKTQLEFLNQRRAETFGNIDLKVEGTARLRTEQRAVPRDIVAVGHKLLAGFQVFLGLKKETQVEDVFTVQAIDPGDELLLTPHAFDKHPDLFGNPAFQKDFRELFDYYRDAKLLNLRLAEGRLLAVFQTGQNLDDCRTLRWRIEPTGRVTYADNRRDDAHQLPPQHDFDWIRTSREDHVTGTHPHVNILNEVFIETVGGNLTVKIENNTESGQGIYQEPVDDPRQSLDDAEFAYAKVGRLILLRVLPYGETSYRHLVFNPNRSEVRRIDAIGLACQRLPEDHGIIFPGGYYLENGDGKMFPGAVDDLEFLRKIRAPNGEDILYVFTHRADGQYQLLPYNLITKSVASAILCQGMAHLDDGRMLILPIQEEPSRVHPVQIWRTPFVSDEYAAKAPQNSSLLSRIGNADLVRGISECLSIHRLIETEPPSRKRFDDIIQSTTRVQNAFYWLAEDEIDLSDALTEIRTTAEKIVGEFEKVATLQARAENEVRSAAEAQKKLLDGLHVESFGQPDEYLSALTELRKQRGRLITLKELRYVDAQALNQLEAKVINTFDQVSQACVQYMLTGAPVQTLATQMEALLVRAEAAKTGPEIEPLYREIETLSEGLNLLSEVLAGIDIPDPNQRTQVLEMTSEVFAQLNRVRTTVDNRRKSLRSGEAHAEFGAQVRLLEQSVSSAVAASDTPEQCEEQLSRLLVQLEELEARFADFDEFLGELAAKRTDVYSALEGKKQQLLEERQRRAQNLATAAGRIFDGIGRRVQSLKNEQDLAAYFATDAMVLKLRQVVESLRALGDSVKADDIESRIKSERQTAFRNLRDQNELFEGSPEGEVIRLGQHRFSVNTQTFELTILPKDDRMFVHLTGTEFYEPIADERFEAMRNFWGQYLVSENDEVYRAEYLASECLSAYERGQAPFDPEDLSQDAHDEKRLLEAVRTLAKDRYDEGYDRGIHDHDAARILEKLLGVYRTAGLLRFSPKARALAVLFWGHTNDELAKVRFHRRAMSLGRLRKSLRNVAAEEQLTHDLRRAVETFAATHELGQTLGSPARVAEAAAYLFEELTQPNPRFILSAGADRLKQALVEHLDRTQSRSEFERDLEALEGAVGTRFELARIWLQSIAQKVLPSDPKRPFGSSYEAAALLLTETRMDRLESAAPTHVSVSGLLGSHPRIKDRNLDVFLDEFLARMATFREERVPGFRKFRALRNEIVEQQRARLRIEEMRPRVLTSFVRNRLINDVYLPLIGDNLAKQLGASGERKRTDLMGLLLLVSPPGYGKTTLMEYVASRLGMVFMKVNGPALGHGVTSLDPNEAPNATARQEVNKVNLAFEMSSNVLLYIDDIQHTHSEFLQKFISLCDAQRRVEGVWNGRTRTYDLRGKKFAIVMAGNPYTETGEKFQIPDMLANRADTYNLGDILTGKDDVFALSFIENALTSNAALAPIAARSLEDIHVLIRNALGQETAASDLQHDYAAVEIDEAVLVLQKLFQVRNVLLKVNAQYIASASQDDRFRTEPRFQLQGSYRNMNKLAEKVVSAMRTEDIEALVDDHYASESQPLTSGAEANLLKLAELRGRLTQEQSARWTQIKQDFRRLSVQGGADDDPVTRLTSTLGSLGDRLDGIRQQIATGVARENNGHDAISWVPGHLERLDEAVRALTTPKLNIELRNEAPHDVVTMMATQLETLEASLLPLVQASTQNLESLRDLGAPLLELVELMRLSYLTKSTS